MPVVDASVVVDLVAPHAAEQEQHLRALFRSWGEKGDSVLAPRLLAEEVRNALLTGIRRQRWSGAAADEAAMMLDRMPLDYRDDDRDCVRAWELARRYDNWPIYDMVYVALAERLEEQLVTADDRLRNRLAHLGWIVAPG